MHGLGNDYLFIDCFNNECPKEKDLPKIAMQISDRHFGIGSDGIILILPPENKKNDARMRVFNSDSSEGEMCGNGIRVMARYLVLRGHQREGIFAIDTRAGIKHLRVPADADISVNMGKVYDEAEEVTASVNGAQYSGFNINVGNPHAVVFTDNLANLGSLAVAPSVEPASSYPDGVS